MRAYSGFDVDSCEEEVDPQGEAYGDVRCSPPGRSVRGFGDGEDCEREAGDDGQRAEVVHFNRAWGCRVLHTGVRDRKDRGCECDGYKDPADPEIEAPAQELADDACNEDSSEESEDRGCAIDGEDEIFAWSGSIERAHQHDPCREEGRSS